MYCETRDDIITPFTNRSRRVGSGSGELCAGVLMKLCRALSLFNFIQYLHAVTDGWVSLSPNTDASPPTRRADGCLRLQPLHLCS